MNLLYPTFTLRQFGWMLVFAAVGAFIAGVYGIVHDQITFTLGYEYFTEFKFHQFHYLDQSQPERLLVAEIGFLATWWVGVFAGWFMGRSTLPRLPLKQSAQLSLQGVAFMMLTALVFAIIAYHMAPVTTEDSRMARWQGLLMPNDVIDAVAFVQVGYIHNASYLGGLVGLILVLVGLNRQARFTKGSAVK
jgi:hypothetical protein